MDLGATSAPPSPWAHLSPDLAELILSHLPLRSLLRASAVCRHWRSLVSDPLLRTRTRNPWFFLYGQNNIFLKQNQAFGYDPDSDSWTQLPPDPLCFAGAGGLAFSLGSATRFSYSPLLRRAPPRETSPLFYPRLNPLVEVFSGARRIVVVGGARFIGGLVDIEDRLAAEIYDPAADTWELAPPLPAEFRTGNTSSQCLCSALLHDRLLFVFGIFSNTLSAFDLATKSWTGVRILRPPGVLFSFLIACGGRLVLAGLRNASFVLWVVDYESLECREIGAMPRDLMACLFDGGGDDDDAKFASLKCVGLDGLAYVFNEDHHKEYPACICKVGDDLVCNWKKVPPLPGPVNQFHKVIAFCSPVPLHSVLGLGGGP